MSVSGGVETCDSAEGNVMVSGHALSVHEAKILLPDSPSSTDEEEEEGMRDADVRAEAVRAERLMGTGMVRSVNLQQPWPVPAGCAAEEPSTREGVLASGEDGVAVAVALDRAAREPDALLETPGPEHVSWGSMLAEAHEEEAGAKRLDRLLLDAWQESVKETMVSYAGMCDEWLDAGGDGGMGAQWSLDGTARIYICVYMHTHAHVSCRRRNAAHRCHQEGVRAGPAAAAAR